MLETLGKDNSSRLSETISMFQIVVRILGGICSY